MMQFLVPELPEVLIVCVMLIQFTAISIYSKANENWIANGLAGASTVLWLIGRLESPTLWLLYMLIMLFMCLIMIISSGGNR